MHSPSRKGQEPIGVLSREGYRLAIEKLEENKERQRTLKESYCFPDGMDQINLYPKPYFDSIYNSTSRESTSHITEKLIEIAKSLF